MIRDISDWVNEVSSKDFIWYVKRLSGNDTLANGSHQAGPYIPKEFLFKVFPLLNRKKAKNPDKYFDLVVDSHADHRKARAIWYNNQFYGGTRDEARLTSLGGASSPLLDPESTGALVVFAFLLDAKGEVKECHVWVCRHEIEEDIIEERIGPVEPGKGRIWYFDGKDKVSLTGLVDHTRISCWLKPKDIPSKWLIRFPSPKDIILKTVSLRPGEGMTPDFRLMTRRKCEYEIFKSVEEAIELPFIKKGFASVEEFVTKAQTILQRRKARAGRSLELHTKEILVEEGLKEGKDFSHQPESDPDKRPDFLFPSEKAYKDKNFPETKLRMLAVKTTCRDRWRQVINEADRIKTKHLLTLQEGVSKSQFREMARADIKLVVPETLMHFYPKVVQPQLQNLESFIGDIRLLNL